MMSLANGHIALGDIYRDEDKTEDAVAEYQKAIKGDATSAIAHAKRGSALIDLGRFQEAAESLETAIRLDPEMAWPYRDLGGLVRHGEYQFSDSQIQGIQRLLELDETEAQHACEFHFTLGDIYDARGDHDAAFKAYDQANSIRHQMLSNAGSSFDVNYFENTVEETIATFDESFFEKANSWGLNTELPVFVVGMPRSGTTLVEQILASHPNIQGVGERRDVALLASELPALTGNPDEPYPRCAKNLSAPVSRSLAEQYLGSLGSIGDETLRFVDKTPTNFLLLGFILSMFPKARVIRCLREPRDIALSCYFQNFSNVEWSHRLQDIGVFYRGYVRVMEHWQRVLPDRVHNVSYEQLVADSDTTCREMIAFCDLPWSDTCLNFHQQRTAVKTASRVQVRKPLNAKSVGRWKPYEAHLAPFTTCLEDLT